jgi:acetyl esterase/lipase
MIKDCKAQVNDLIIDRKKLIISGESAGGYVAAYSVIRPHKKLEVKALFLRYPMLRHYERVDRNELKLKYMGTDIDKENVEENAPALWTFVHQTMRPAMKAAGLLGLSDEGIYADILDRRSPPYGMCGALTSSWLGTWSDYLGMTTKGERLDDILTQLLRANRRDEDVGPHKAPALFIYHGTKDINVPLEVSETFVEEWKRMFKSHDLNGKVHLKTVDAGHGFDYTLHDDDKLDNETTMGGFMDDLATFWKFV